jgi:hypothetical protein
MKLVTLFALAASLATLTTLAPPSTASDVRAAAADGKALPAPAVPSRDGSGASIGTPYCTSVPCSTGAVPDLIVRGSAVAADDDVTLVVTGLPLDSYGVFLTSRFAASPMSPAGSLGNICVRRDIGRFAGPGQVRSSGGRGAVALSTSLGEWSTQNIPRSSGTYLAMAGGRTHFQYWFRDSIGGRATSNFSEAEYVDWQ